MESLKFILKILSPAFVAGAMEKKSGQIYYNNDGTSVEPMHRIIGPNVDGLRPPSLKGLLRFWFRAKEGDRNLPDLKKKESEIFGDTNFGQGIRLVLKKQEPFDWQPQKIGGGGSIPAGSSLAYLGYGPLNYVPGDEKVSSYNKNMHRDAIPVDTRFSFCAFGNENQITELKKVLLLLHLFGGVGGRSRRAWGSVAVESDYIPQKTTGENINKWFKDCLDLIWPDNEEKPSNKSSLPAFSAFSRFSVIKISQNYFNSYEDVMKEFGRQFKDTRQWKFRDRYGSPIIAQEDHDLERDDAINHTLTGLPKRLAFGLPYHPSSRNGWDIEYKGYFPNPDRPTEKKVIDRRSSPLFLKIFQIPDTTQLGAVILFLKGKYFGIPNAEVGTNDPDLTFPVSDWSAIDAFLSRSNWNQINLP